MNNTTNISKTAYHNFNIKRGDTFYFDFQILNDDEQAVDLSAFTAAQMKVKTNAFSESVLTLSTSGGSINIGNISAGRIILSASTENVAANTYYYDLELSNSTNFIQTVMSGKILVENDYSK